MCFKNQVKHDRRSSNDSSITYASGAEQIMTETNNSNIIKLNRVKNPKWPEANQLVIYKRGRGFELVTTVNKSSQRSGWDLNSSPPNTKSSAQTTRLRCLLPINKYEIK